MRRKSLIAGTKATTTTSRHCLPAEPLPPGVRLWTHASLHPPQQSRNPPLAQPIATRRSRLARILQPFSARDAVFRVLLHGEDESPVPSCQSLEKPVLAIPPKVLVVVPTTCRADRNHRRVRERQVCVFWLRKLAKTNKRRLQVRVPVFGRPTWDLIRFSYFSVNV